MPISDDEWADGESREAASANDTTPVSEYESERNLVVSFLSENVDNAYTRAEIVRGVDFGESEDPETIREVLFSLDDAITDLAGDATASGMLVDDIDAVLDELVEEGLVAEKTIETDGEETTYYRLNTAESRD